MAEYHSIKMGVSRQKSLLAENNMNAHFEFAKKHLADPQEFWNNV